MLLRRVIEHVKTQNWTAVALDFVIVVMGVFIGIQVANWNETRLDRVRERALITRLTADFIDIDARLTESVNLYDAYIQSVEHVSQVVEDGTPPQNDADVEQFAKALRGVVNSRLPAWSSATFQEMQASGAIDLIQNTEIKKALLDYDQSTQISQNGFGLLSERALAYSDPLFQSVRFKANLDTIDGTKSFSTESFDFQKMRDDPRFLSALSVQLTVHANNRVLQAMQLDKTKAVLDLLRSENP